MPTDPVTIITWASLAGALLLALRSWLTFADQPVIPLRRSFVVGSYPHRSALRLGTLGILGLGLVAWSLSPASVPALPAMGMAVLTGLFWAWAFYAPTLRRAC